MEPLQAPLEGKENRMKKLLAVAAAALAACMLFVFVGCDEGESGNNGGPSSSAKREVTEEEWEAAVSGADTGSCSYAYETTYGESGTQGGSFTYDAGKNAVLNTLSGGNYSGTGILTKEGDMYYAYESEDDGWVRSASSAADYEDWVETVCTQAQLLATPLAGQYSLFTYADGAYTYTGSEISFGLFSGNVTSLTVKVTFADGALWSVAVEPDLSASDGNATEQVFTARFGSAVSIAIPADYTEA